MESKSYLEEILYQRQFDIHEVKFLLLIAVLHILISLQDSRPFDFKIKPGWKVVVGGESEECVTTQNTVWVFFIYCILYVKFCMKIHHLRENAVEKFFF